MAIVTLHQHQLDALDKIKNAITQGNGTAIGRVVMPTGAGKTFVEAAVIDTQISEYTGIHLVLAPRIVLATQLIEEYRKYGGKKYRAIAFHSGKHEPDYETVKWQERATTIVAILEEEYKKAKLVGTDLVVFSTYHSCGKLAGIKFDTIIADESQYCVSENFNNYVKALTGRVKLFFTATERHTASNKGRGLNNENVFGKLLYKISPAELIQKGYIVAPRLHVMYGETKDEEKSIINEVMELATEQNKLTAPELGFSKILFAMKGTKDVKTVSDNLAKLKVALPDHTVFTITSKTGAQVNGVKIGRDSFLEKLRNAKNALIFHYDILSEGIDVPGITGVCLMRNLGLAKLLQTIGRAVRLYKQNGVNIKRQAWISVPVLNGGEDDKEQVRKVIFAIRDGGFDISSELVHETGRERHHGDDEDIGDAYGNLKLNLSLFSIDNIIHEHEEGKFWEKIAMISDPDEKIDALFEGV
jgi:superfamily II DNA or RNA helicase